MPASDKTSLWILYVLVIQTCWQTIPASSNDYEELHSLGINWDEQPEASLHAEMGKDVTFCWNYQYDTNLALPLGATWRYGDDSTVIFNKPFGDVGEPYGDYDGRVESTPDCNAGMKLKNVTSSDFERNPYRIVVVFRNITESDGSLLNLHSDNDIWLTNFTATPGPNDDDGLENNYTGTLGPPAANNTDDKKKTNIIVGVVVTVIILVLVIGVLYFMRKPIKQKFNRTFGNKRTCQGNEGTAADQPLSEQEVKRPPTDGAETPLKNSLAV